MSSDRPYHENARRFFDQYQSIDFDQVHRDWIAHLPSQPGMALCRRRSYKSVKGVRRFSWTLSCRYT